jgi:antitoxin VapB
MEGMQMKTTTIFKNGPSTQAVRIPMEYRLSAKEVWVEKVHNGLLIIPKAESWDDFFLSTPKVSKGFSTERNQRHPQKRDDL